MEAILLYDGFCPLCNKSVRFILKHEKTTVFKFAQLQTSHFTKITAEVYGKELPDSLVILYRENNRQWLVAVKSEAVFMIIGFLKFPWRWLKFLQLIPKPLRDWKYDIISRIRNKIWGRYEVCPLPPEQYQSRFLSD